LKEISNYAITKHTQSFELILKLLAIKDEWQVMRAEWILGQAHPIQSYNYGLNVISDIKSDVNAYDSLLLCDKGEKPLLQLMWNYQKHYEEIVLFSLKQLLSLANNDKVIYTYLRDMPPPSYLYSRYTDWVPEFLEYCTNLNSLIKSDKLKKVEIIIAETVKELALFSSKVAADNAAPPQFYMTGKILQTQTLDNKTIDLGDVKLTVTEVVVEVYESKPTGEYNAGVSGAYLRDYFKHYCIRNRDEYDNRIEQGKDEYSIICERSYGKEEYKDTSNVEDLQKEWEKTMTTNKNKLLDDDNLEVRGSELNNVKEKEPEVEVGNNQEPTNNEPQATSEPNTIEGDANPLEQENMIVVVENNLTVIHSEKIKIKDIQDSIPSINYTTIENEHQYNYKTNAYNIDDKDVEKQEKSLVEKSAGRIRQLFKPLAVFHRIEIHNSIHFDRTIKLILKPAEGSRPNFYVPQSKLKVLIPKYERQIYHLQKNKPEEEFGEYVLDLYLAKQKEPSSVFSNAFQAAQSSSAAPNEVPKISGNSLYKQ
jgi:hypothetical protein